MKNQSISLDKETDFINFLTIAKFSCQQFIAAAIYSALIDEKWGLCKQIIYSISIYILII